MKFQATVSLKVYIEMEYEANDMDDAFAIARQIELTGDDILHLGKSPILHDSNILDFEPVELEGLIKL